MYEAEIKLSVRNPADVDSKLRRLSKTDPRHLKYRDVYFDRPSAEFAQAERELRVREITEFEGGKVKSLVTFKGSPFDAETRSKEELEVEVGDSSCAIRLFEKLGFVQTISFEKDCTSFRIIFDDIVIDTTMVRVPELASSFLECEIQVQRETEISNTFDTLRRLATVLGFSRADETSDYYTDLIRRARGTAPAAE